MMDFIITAAAVMVGSLAAGGVAVALLCSKKVLKAYSRHVMKVSMEIGEELAEEQMSKDEEES